MRLEYSRRAQADIAEIHVYLSSRSLSGARRVAGEIRRAAELVRDAPESGAKTNIPLVRVKWVRGFPYKLFYQFASDVVTILHVRHTSRSPWLG